MWDAIPSVSAGMPPLGKLTEGVATPQLEKKGFAKEFAPLFAEAMGHPGPTPTDMDATKKLFERRLPLDFIRTRVKAYLGPEGKRFRQGGTNGSQPTAHWLFRAICEDYANHKPMADPFESARILARKRRWREELDHQQTLQSRDILIPTGTPVVPENYADYNPEIDPRERDRLPAVDYFNVPPIDPLLRARLIAEERQRRGLPIRAGVR